MKILKARVRPTKRDRRTRLSGFESKSENWSGDFSRFSLLCAIASSNSDVSRRLPLSLSLRYKNEKKQYKSKAKREAKQKRTETAGVNF